MIRIIILLFIFGVPHIAHAMEETVWDFTKGTPGSWEFFECTQGSPTNQGLYVYAQGPCRFFRDLHLDHAIDTLTLTVQAPQNISAVFLWHPDYLPEGHMVQLPFLIPASEQPSIIELNPSSYGSQWDSHPDRIGIILNQPGEVLLQEIHLQHWSFFEKIREGFLSFWTFHMFRPHTINFLWGPITVFNPIWRAQVFQLPPPPKGWFSGYIFYPLILLAGSISALIFWKKRTKKNALLFFVCCFAALWIVFDIRMGLEVLSYAKTDLQNYVFAEPGYRSFRAFEDFYDVYEKSFPYIEAEELYGVAPMKGSPFATVATYMTYPKTVITPQKALDQKLFPRIWLIYRRDDMFIDGEGRLVWIQGKDVYPVSKPGKIVEIFSDESFLFQES